VKEKTAGRKPELLREEVQQGNSACRKGALANTSQRGEKKKGVNVPREDPTRKTCSLPRKGMGKT